MPNGKNQKTQCEMKTDLNLLLECLKYQMNHPASQKEALITIYSVCQENRDASDYFREIGGLMFVHNLAKSSTQSAVREASLFTLGGLAENNVFCQQILCTSGLFEDLRMFLINEDSSVNLKRVSVYVLLMLTSNNKSGQTCVRESGCLDVMLQIFRTTLSVSEASMLDQNINKYHLWSSVCSALCACVNNPHNEDNQNACSSVFPHAKYWLQSCTKPEIVRPICSFIGLTVANNSRIQHFFASIGGLAILDELLVKLIQNSAGNCSNTKLAVVVIKTLDACIADNSAIGISLSRYNIVANLLALLSYNILDSGEKFSVILTLGHCTDGCEENQYALVKNNGLPLMIQALTESQDEELNKAATFVLHNCKAITEKLSLKPTEHSLNMDSVGQMEVALQKRERIFEDYQDKAKQILCRIERLENEHQEEKVRRQIHIVDDIPQEEIIQLTSKHLQINAGDQHFDEVVTDTKMNRPLLNSAYQEVIPTNCVHGLSKNELLKAAIGNASVSQSGHTKLPHSADKMKTFGINKVHITNKSTGCESSRSDVQPSEVMFKQQDFVVGCMTQQVQNTVDLQTMQDTCLKENPVKHKNCFKDQDLSENHAYSLDEDEDAEVHLSNTPAIVFKKQRRTRKDFTSEEINYLLEGVKKMGHHWNSILWSYPFQKGRTNVDLAKKYCKLQRNEKNKNI
ncbi:telomere repeats-binding bouquet formation protein 1 [Tiliqua scincoides]|uniref:telomere repeats-binding bouquet formation protein 1 n=1 Tax=Tiliqua scincoides TaxID=71010 RepID=UPI0034629F3C